MARKTTRKSTKAKKTSRKKATTKSARPAAQQTTKKKTTKKKAAKTTTKKSKARKPSTKKTTAKKKTAKTPKKAATAKKKTTRRSPASRAKPPTKSRSKTPATTTTTPPESNKKPRAPRKLSPKDIDEFRQMLLEKRAEILGDVTTLHSEARHQNRSEAAGDLSSMPIHMADLGTDNYELEFTLGLIEGERTILKEIDEALERIERGEYGLCLATGQPIGKARLRARPWAKYCYEYTLAQEKGQTGRF